MIFWIPTRETTTIVNMMRVG